MVSACKCELCTMADTKTVSPKQIFVGQVKHIVSSFITNWTESGAGKISIESVAYEEPQ